MLSPYFPSLPERIMMMIFHVCEYRYLSCSCCCWCTVLTSTILLTSFVQDRFYIKIGTSTQGKNDSCSPNYVLLLWCMPSFRNPLDLRNSYFIELHG